MIFTSDYMSRWIVLKRRVGAVTSQRVLKVLFYVNILQCFFVVEHFTANVVSVAIGDNGNRLIFEIWWNSTNNCHEESQKYHSSLKAKIIQNDASLHTLSQPLSSAPCCIGVHAVQSLFVCSVLFCPPLFVCFSPVSFDHCIFSPSNQGVC